MAIALPSPYRLAYVAVCNTFPMSPLSISMHFVHFTAIISAIQRLERIETFEGGRRILQLDYLKHLSIRESSYPNRPFIMSPSSLPKKVLVGIEGKVRRAWDIRIHAAFKMKEEEVQVDAIRLLGRSQTIKTILGSEHFFNSFNCYSSTLRSILVSNSRIRLTQS